MTCNKHLKVNKRLGSIWNGFFSWKFDAQFLEFSAFDTTLQGMGAARPVFPACTEHATGAGRGTSGARNTLELIDPAVRVLEE